MNGFKKRFTRLLVVLMLMFYHVPVLAAPPADGADIEVKIDKFNVDTAYEVTYAWTLDKSVDDSELFLHVGDSQTVNYTVAVTKTLTSTFSITYTITIVNTGPGTAEFGLGVEIAKPAGSPVYTTQFLENVTLADGATFQKTYTTSFQIPGLASNLDPLKISAVITELNNSLDNVKHGTSPAVNFTDTPTGTFNESITVTDSFAGVGPWTFTDSGSVTYSRTFTANSLTTVEYLNTVTSSTLANVTPSVLTDSVTVSVTGVNSLPVADDKNINVSEGGTVGGSVTASDSDNDPLTFELVDGPLYESAFTFNADGSFSYTHDGSENHSDSFTFKVSDGFGYSNLATVTITVDPVNDAPTANDDSFSVDEGNTHTGSVTGSDPENDTLSFILVDGPLYGFLTFNPDGTFTYEHDGSETTSDSFTFKVNDGSLDSNVATVTITINPVNDAPTANDDSFTGDEGGTISDFVTGSDPENDTLTFILVSDVSNGTLTLNPDGTFTYVHDGSENHSDGFTFKVNDGSVDSNVATVIIAINAVNDAPEADDDSFTINEGAVLNGNVSGSDPDGDTLTYVLVTGPSYYTSFVFNPDGSFVYDHDGSETTQTTFTFKAYDGFLYSGEATITINITPVNDAPVALSDDFTVAEGGTLNDQVFGTDAENDTLTFILVDDVANGTLTLNPDGTFTYVHDGSETSSDSFTFKVNDGALDSNTATVTITVTPINDAPVADDDSFTIPEGGTENGTATGSDADGDSLEYILVDSPLYADYFIFNPDGTYTYIHDGSENFSDSFTFKVNDGTVDSNTATITITITPVNDAPLALNDDFIVAEGGTLNDQVFGTDAENDTLTYILVDDVVNGTLTLNSDGTFTYIHDGSETASDSFTIKVNDGEYDSNIATVAITVTPVNDAPVALDDDFVVDEGGTLNDRVDATDAENDPLTYSIVIDAQFGSLTLYPDGTFTYIHDGSENHSDSFTFKVSDGQLDSNDAYVTIRINPVNDAPVANDDSFTVDEGGTLNDVVTGSDAEDDDLEFILVTDVAYGTLTLNPDGTFTYVHDGSENHTDGFIFKVNDGEYDSNIATVTITVDPVNDAPVADDDSFTLPEGGTENGTATGSDVDGDDLTFILVDGPLYADFFEFNPDGTYTYVHDGSENFSDSFTFKVNDGALDSNTATITITITPVNDAPVADDDTFTVDEGGTLNEAASGSDIENDPLTFILVNDVQYGTLTFNDDGTFTYIHDGSENFSDSFTFKVNDGDLDSNTATITINITPVNDAPEADDDGFAVDEGATYNGDVTGSDPDGDDLTFILVDGPTNAVSFTFNPDGSFSYVHDGSETTVDSFTFKVNDGTVDSNVATIDIVINPINDGPTSANDAFTIIEGASYPGTLAGVDPDGPSLSWIIVTQPTQGTLVQGLNGAYTYTHNGGTATADSFTFYVTDGLLSSQIYTVNITITQLPEPNGAPVSTPDAITVNEGGSVDDRVNGSDPDGDRITYILVGDVVNGTLIFNANGTYRYTHNGSETTADSFSYRVSDGRRLSAISVVTITVIPVNEAPVAVNGELDTDFEEPVNGSLVSLISDVDSTSFAYILVTDVQHGTLTLNADGTFTYTPDAGFEGEDSFTFKANDGELDSNVATFTITVAEEVIIVDPETPLAPLNYWWLLLLPLLLLLLFLRPNLKYELVDASGNKKTIRRHIFAKGDEDVFVDLNDKDMQNLVHVDLTVYKQLVKRQQGQKITFNLFKKPMKTIEVPDDMKDPIKDRIEL